AERCRLDRGLVAAVDGDRPSVCLICVRLAGVAGGGREARPPARRRERPAPENPRADVQQGGGRGRRGGGGVDREREVVAAHAGTVVADANEPAPAAVGEDVDARRAGIERVLDELLDHARGALDHLAGSDAVDDAFGELADGHPETWNEAWNES